MLQFFLGVLVGGVIGFAAFCAICSVDTNNDRTESSVNKETKDKDTTSKRFPH